MQVRTPNTGGKKRISCKEEGIIEQIAGALQRMPRRMQCCQHQVLCGERVAIMHRRKGKRYPTLIRQIHHRSTPFGELARAREMISMDMRVEDARDLPA